jgi:hypothetical protein
MFNTSGVVPIQTEHASTTIHGINVKINDSPEKMCGITRGQAPVANETCVCVCVVSRAATTSCITGDVAQRNYRNASLLNVAVNLLE